uniref:Dynein regulatory complex protein 10 n=1 Tax=Palpitomonas bilix TaxID=652834 RepID=A0A7S3G1T5_9EUKA|mmetsp:Transcript_11605/g.31160  ORF Transcript_11605/g.31160 Transcript_11605/m.31160 type:complete len:1516 (+) Transcript_11605:74-4621(+)
MLSHSESLGPRAARASMAGEDSVQPLHGFIDEDIAVGLMVSPISVGEAAWACLHSLRLSRPLMVALRGEKGKEAAEKLLQVVCTSLLLPSPPGFSITSSSKAPFEFLYEGDSPGGSMRLGADEASSPYTFTHPLRWFWAVQVDGAISRQFEKVTYKCFFAQSQASKAASHSLSSSLEELEEGQARLLCPSLPANVGAKRTLINMCNTGGLAESGVCRVWGSYGQTLASSEEWKESDEQLRGALAPLLRLLTDFKLCDYRGQVLLVPVECFGGSAGRIEDVLRYTPSSSDEQVKRWQSLYRALLSQRVARAKDGALFPRSSFHPLLGRSGMSSVCEVAEARIRAVVDTFGIALAEMRAMPLADREGGVSVLDLVEKVGNEVPFPPFTSAENKTSLVITYASSSLRHLMGKQVSGRSEAAYRAVESGQTTAVEGEVEEAAAEESERGAEMGARLELEKRKIVCIPLVSGDSPAYGRSASAQRGSGVRLRTFGCLLVCADEEWSEAERQAVESVASLVGTWLALVEQMSLMEALHLISQSGRALHVPAAVSDAITASVSADAYFGSSLETKSIDHDKRWQSRSADAVWARATTKDAANLDLQCAFSPGVSSELQSVKRSVEEKEAELVNTMKGWEGVGESDVQSPIQSAFSYLSAASEEIKLSWDKAMVEVDLPGANKQAEVLMVVSEAKHLLLVKHRLERWLILFGPRWVKDGGKPDGKVDEVSLNIIAGALMLLGGMSMDEDMKVWKAIKVALSIGSGSAAKELLWARLPLFDPTSTDTVKNEKKFNTLRSMMNVCRLKAGSSPLLLTERILYCWLCVCDQIRRCAVHTMSLHSSLSGAERKGGFGVAVDDAIASMVDMRVRYAAEAISVAADTAGRPESVTLQPAVENSFKKPFTASQVLDRAKRPLADKVTLQYAGIDCLPSCPLQVAVDRRTLTSLHRFGVSGASEGLLPIVYPLRSGRPLFLGVAAHAVGGEERAGEGEKRLYFNATFDAAVVARAGRMQSRMLTTVGEKGVGSASRRSVQPSPSDLSSGGGSFLNDMREAGVARREGVAMWLDESLAAMLHLTSDAVLEGEEGEREGVDTLFICGETGNVVLRAGWTRPVPVIHIELLRALVALSESVVERPVSAGMTEDMSTATPFELSVVEGQGQERRHSVTAVKFLSTLRTTLNEAVLLSARPRGGEGEEEEEVTSEAQQVFDAHKSIEVEVETLAAELDEESGFENLEESTEQLRESTKVLVRYLRGNPEMVAKMKKDTAVSTVRFNKIMSGLKELVKRDLQTSVEEAKTRARELKEVEEREKNATREMHKLQKSLTDERKAREKTMAIRNETIKKLQDEIDEIKRATKETVDSLNKRTVELDTADSESFKEREESLTKEINKRREELLNLVTDNQSREDRLRKERREKEENLKTQLEKYDTEMIDLDDQMRKLTTQYTEEKKQLDFYEDYFAKIEKERQSKEAELRRKQEEQERIKQEMEMYVVAAQKIQAVWIGYQTRKYLNEKAKRAGGKKVGI